MKINTDRITKKEREALATMAAGLRKIALHTRTSQLAGILDQWAKAPAGMQLDTAALDAVLEQVKSILEKMNRGDKAIYKAEFHALEECAFAARGAGMGAPESFSDNLADATSALRAALNATQ
jgi:hypothetical protein